MITWTELNPIIDLLRDDRLKINTDYSVLLKYEVVYIMCFEVYEPRIVKTFKSHGIDVIVKII